MTAFLFMLAGLLTMAVSLAAVERMGLAGMGEVLMFLWVWFILFGAVQVIAGL